MVNGNYQYSDPNQVSGMPAQPSGYNPHYQDLDTAMRHMQARAQEVMARPPQTPRLMTRHVELDQEARYWEEEQLTQLKSRMMFLKEELNRANDERVDLGRYCDHLQEQLGAVADCMQRIQALHSAKLITT